MSMVNLLLFYCEEENELGAEADKKCVWPEESPCDGLYSPCEEDDKGTLLQ